MTTALLRPYMRGAITTVPTAGRWPRSFVINVTDERGRRWRTEYTLHSEGSALFSAEARTDTALSDPPVIGWLSWSAGEVVVAFRDTATGSHGGGILADAAPLEDGPLEHAIFDVDRWTHLAEEVLATIAESKAAPAG